MVNLKLMTVAMIAVLQVCTANPISSEEENDPAKLFTEDELVQAKSVGIPRRALVEGKSFGFTFEEMIKLHAMRNGPFPAKFFFEDVTKGCEILVPGHKTTPNSTSAQVEELRNLVKLIKLMPTKEQLPFVRTSVCGFVSQPQSFDQKFVPHTKIRFLKSGAEDSTGLDRVKVAKQMCCINEGGDILDDSKLSGLPDENMKEFDDQWNGFDTTNVPDSIKKMCDFLHARNSVDDDQCQKISPLDDDDEIHS